MIAVKLLKVPDQSPLAVHDDGLFVVDHCRVTDPPGVVVPSGTEKSVTTGNPGGGSVAVTVIVTVGLVPALLEHCKE